MSTYNNLNELFKAICDAIRSKTGTTDLINHTDIPAKIEEIETGGGSSGGGDINISSEFAGLLMKDTNASETYINGKLDEIATAANQGKYLNLTNLFNGSSVSTLNYDFSNFGDRVINAREMFSNCSSLTSLDLSTLDSKNIIDMNSMFSDDYNLTTLTLDMDTSKVGDMYYMFYNCSKLTSLTLGENFTTEQCTDMGSMFASCRKLTTLDLRSFNTKNVKSMAQMFYLCSALTYLDISSFEINADTDMYNMLSSCNALATLILPDLTKRTSNIEYFLTSSSSNLNITWGGELKTFGDPSISSDIDLRLTQVWRGNYENYINNFVNFANSIGPKLGNYNRSITIYTSLYNALSDEQRALITDKGYYLNSSSY